MSFRNFKGFSIIFPKILDSILSFYERENFSDSYLNHIFESENFRFPFFYEKQQYLMSEMWRIKLRKIVGDLLDKFPKLYMNGTVI